MVSIIVNSAVPSKTSFAGKSATRTCSPERLQHSCASPRYGRGVVSTFRRPGGGDSSHLEPLEGAGPFALADHPPPMPRSTPGSGVAWPRLTRGSATPTTKMEPAAEPGTPWTFTLALPRRGTLPPSQPLHRLKTRTGAHHADPSLVTGRPAFPCHRFGADRRDLTAGPLHSATQRSRPPAAFARAPFATLAHRICACRWALPLVE
jgi:hypothetical protein